MKIIKRIGVIALAICLLTTGVIYAVANKTQDPFYASDADIAFLEDMYEGREVSYYDHSKDDLLADGELNVLMIGNSFCYYYVEELYGMLTAAGYENVNICNVYYSGCELEQHWKWWKNGEANYDYYTTNENGRKKTKSGADLAYCLQQQNWDIISLQESSRGVRESGGAEQHLRNTNQYLTDLWGYIKEQFPQARHLWHQSWTYQIGYDRNGYQMKDINQQLTDTLSQKDYSLRVCDAFGLERVNTGEAWHIVRQGGYDNLCARLSINDGEGDYYHDGDIGGGQYLNACVWFETITGQSCVGNTYRPNYSLDEQLIPTFQQAAHQVTIDHTNPKSYNNHKLWTDQLTEGERIWATAGCDLPIAKTFRVVYAEKEDDTTSYLNEGDFVCGNVGIRMAIGEACMGGQTDFNGKRVVFSVGDWHSSVLKEGHTYKVDIISDNGVVYSKTLDTSTTNYFAFDADENASFYRMEIYDEDAAATRIAIGNPIWND